MSVLMRSNLVKVSKQAIALAAFGATLVFSQAALAECDHGHWNKEEHHAFIEKKQNELHDKLKLSADQEAAWKAYVSKTKPESEHAKPDWAEMSKLTTPDRLDRMAAMMKEHQAQMESRIADVKEFYAKLTPEQKKIFDENFMPPMPHHHEAGN